MKILSHRGYWSTAREKNTAPAFVRSFERGFGTETDVRDSRGALVISHDVPQGGEPTLAELLGLCRGRRLTLALNIKADGLADLLRQELRQAGIDDYFVFDMSVPDQQLYLQLGMPVFTRVSELEPAPANYERAQGIWLDAFHSTWYTAREVEGFLADGKSVCIVSPELHRRPHEDLWRLLGEARLHLHPRLLLCTDAPEVAREFFGMEREAARPALEGGA